MTMLLAALRNVSKSYGHHTVLDQATFLLNRGERIGLVGPNGAGKSTVLKLLLGLTEYDEGEVYVAPTAQVGYLPQTFEPAADVTVAELIAEAQLRLQTMEQEMVALTERMASVEGNLLAELLARYGELSSQFEQLGGYELEYRVQQVLEGLGLGHLPQDRLVSTLSGGEKNRVGLAALLIASPDLLLLDEPTNHLDQGAVQWLEAYLRDFKGTCLLISHDRVFLNKVVTRILELTEHDRAFHEYHGNYDAYLAEKAKERLLWEENYQRQQELIAELEKRTEASTYVLARIPPPRDNDKIAYKGKKGTAQKTISKKIRAAEHSLEMVLKEKIPAPPQPLRFEPRFDPQALEMETAMVVENVAKVLPDGRCLFQEVSLTVSPSSRILIVGPNGAGKTTLLKVLAGKLQGDHGTVQVAPEIQLGFLEQEEVRRWSELSVLGAYRRELIGYEEEHREQLLAYNLFRSEEMERTVRDLSPGQYRKLEVARLMATRANLLILDEPTNHISFDVLEEFETALDSFPGPVIAVSHDRRFIERFGGEVWELADGKLQRQV